MKETDDDSDEEVFYDAVSEMQEEIIHIQVQMINMLILNTNQSEGILHIKVTVHTF